MPANIILINGSLEYIVADSKMEKLIKWLNKNAYDERVVSKKEKDLKKLI